MKNGWYNWLFKWNENGFLMHNRCKLLIPCYKMSNFENGQFYEIIKKNYFMNYIAKQLNIHSAKYLRDVSTCCRDMNSPKPSGVEIPCPF